MTGPRSGGRLRVVEITSGVAGMAGAVCGRLFAGLGHDVLKAEPPGGDPLRRQPPLNRDGTGLAFVALNAGKRSVLIEDAPGPALLDAADVLILDLRPAQAAARGLTPERLREAWPRLVVVWITAFGRDGEFSDLAGDSLLAESYGGLATMIGEAGRPPLSLGGEQAAYCAGVTGFLGAMLALMRRDDGAAGDIVDVALCDVAAYMDWKSDVGYFMTGVAPERAGPGSGEWRLVQASDGWAGFIFQPRHWAAVVELVGAPELRDPALADELTRTARGPQWWPAVERWAAELPAEEIYTRAQRLGLPFGWVVRASGLLASRQLRERGFIRPVPDAGAGLVPVVGAPAHSSALTWRSGPVPGLGTSRAEDLAPGPPAVPPGPPAVPAGPPAVPPGPPAVPPGTPLPLGGVVVLDFGTITAGAAVTRLLADHGATVLKIEWLNRPDTFRSWKMPQAGSAGAESGAARQDSSYFPSNNVGKLGVAIDLKTAGGQRLVRRLAARAHVLVENYRVGVTARLGIDEATLRAANPGLLYLSLSSQGQQGPEARNSSFGSTLDLLSGLASLTGYDGDRPIWSSSEVNYPDQLVSLVGAAFVVYCLRNRITGVSLDVSQREVVSWTLAAELADSLASGHDPVPAGNRRPGRAPHDTFPAAGPDEWLALSCGSDAERTALASCLAAPELAGHDAAWWDVHRTEAGAVIAGWTAKRPRDEAVTLLRDAGVAAVPVLNAAGRAATPRFRERLVTFPTGGVPVKGFPLLFRDYQPPVHLTAPAIGEHTRDVLIRLGGLAPGELSRLEEQGVIFCSPIAQKGEDPWPIRGS